MRKASSIDKCNTLQYDKHGGGLIDCVIIILIYDSFYSLRIRDQNEGSPFLEF